MRKFKCKGCDMDFSRSFPQIPVYFQSGQLYIMCPGCNHTSYLKWNKGKLEFVNPREIGTIDELSSFNKPGITIKHFNGKCSTCNQSFSISIEDFQKRDRLLCASCNEAIILIEQK